MVEATVSTIVTEVLLYQGRVSVFNLIIKDDTVIFAPFKHLSAQKLLFKIYLRNRPMFLLDSVFLLSTEVYLLLRSLMISSVKLVLGHLKSVILAVVRVLINILFSAGSRVIIFMSCNRAIEGQLLLEMH